MGSQAVQSHLWGRGVRDWADIQEKTGQPGYDFALSKLNPLTSPKLLDVGCGTGLFSRLASAKGFNVTGVDATAPFIEEAKKRAPSVSFSLSEMEELPFADKSFDVVCGFNSFQYAASTENALIEAKRVLAGNGKLVVMIWGNKSECEAAAYLKAVGGLLPPPPPGAGGPFALSENQALEKIIEKIGFNISINHDVASIWEYPDTETALRGLMSAGPVTKALEIAGFEKVKEVTLEAISPFVEPDGQVVLRNTFRVVIAEPAS